MTTPSPTPFRPVIRRVVLRTPHAARLADFYQKALGLVAQRVTPDRPDLSLLHPASVETLLTLLEDPAARPPARGAPGLFHIALLYPELDDWRAAVHRFTAQTGGLHGAADHGVSWAVYGADPDGNGLELAWDKPSDQWPWRGEQIAMVSLPLPANSLLPNPGGIPPGVGIFHIGHLHLQVADLLEAAALCDTLDLRGTQSDYAGAVFMARDAYHHHLAVNVWNTRPHLAWPQQAVGLVSWDTTLRDGTTAGGTTLAKCRGKK